MGDFEFEFDEAKSRFNLEEHGIGVTRQSIIKAWLVERLKAGAADKSG